MGGSPAAQGQQARIFSRLSRPVRRLIWSIRAGSSTASREWAAAQHQLAIAHSRGRLSLWSPWVRSRRLFLIVGQHHHGVSHSTGVLERGRDALPPPSFSLGRMAGCCRVIVWLPGPQHQPPLADEGADPSGVRSTRTKAVDAVQPLRASPSCSGWSASALFPSPRGCQVQASRQDDMQRAGNTGGQLFGALLRLQEVSLPQCRPHGSSRNVGGGQQRYRQREQGLEQTYNAPLPFYKTTE